MVRMCRSRSGRAAQRSECEVVVHAGVARGRRRRWGRRGRYCRCRRVARSATPGGRPARRRGRPRCDRRRRTGGRRGRQGSGRGVRAAKVRQRETRVPRRVKADCTARLRRSAYAYAYAVPPTPLRGRRQWLGQSAGCPVCRYRRSRAANPVDQAVTGARRSIWCGSAGRARRVSASSQRQSARATAAGSPTITSTGMWPPSRICLTSSRS
jgi:hypothetical protein